MKILKISLLVFGLLVGGLFIYAIFIFLNTPNKQKTLDEAWRQTTGMTPDEIARSYPKKEKNESARKLEELTVKLRITGESHSAEDVKSVADYFATRRVSDNDEIEELPENIRKYLAIHQNDLAALYDYVQQNEAPQWEMEISEPLTAITLNLPFHVNLNRIIALDILNKTRHAQNEQALKALEASWKASESLRERLDDASHPANFVVFEEQMSVLQKMNDVPSEWQNRIAAYDYRKLGLKTIELQFSSASLSSINSAQAGNSSGLQKFIITSPFYDVNSRLDTSEAGRKIVAHLQEHDFCTFDQSYREPDVAFWNPWGSVRFPAMLQIWENYAELSYEIELTERVLRLKEIIRAAPRSALPQEFPLMESSLCRDSNWIVKKLPDDSLVISFSKVTDLLKNNDEIPLTYTLQAQK